MKKSISLFFAVLALSFCCACSPVPSGDKPVLGVWWWDAGLSADTYLSFAQERGVTEVYYCDDGFNAQTESFIKSASDRGMKVYLLAGEYQWLRNDRPAYDLIESYCAFQSSAEYAFAGVHLDVEPHQDPNFGQDRTYLLESLVALAYGLSVNYPGITFDFDIPFWLDDEIELNGKAKPAYAHMIDSADRIFMMSYRDTAEAVYSVAEDEIDYAKSVGKTLVLGVETYSEEGDEVSFMEEGKQYMYGEIDKLRENLPAGFGVAIHQIKTWYDMKN